MDCGIVPAVHFLGLNGVFAKKGRRYPLYMDSLLLTLCVFQQSKLVAIEPKFDSDLAYTPFYFWQKLSLMIFLIFKLGWLVSR